MELLLWNNFSNISVGEHSRFRIRSVPQKRKLWKRNTTPFPYRDEDNIAVRNSIWVPRCRQGNHSSFENNGCIPSTDQRSRGVESLLKTVFQSPTSVSIRGSGFAVCKRRYQFERGTRRCLFGTVIDNTLLYIITLNYSRWVPQCWQGHHSRFENNGT